MFGISGEHLLILGIVLLIFGPRRLPELGHTMGKAIRNFKDSISGIEEAKFRKIDEKVAGPAQSAGTQTSETPHNSTTQNTETSTHA
jgi:sec-independent protein translocase protein TatA